MAHIIDPITGLPVPDTEEPIPVTDFVSGLVNDPTLPLNTLQSFNVVPLEEQAGEIVSTEGLIGTPTATATTAEATAATTSPTDPATTVPNVPPITPPTIDPTLIEEGAQGTVDQQSLPSVQLENLLDFPQGEVPVWASGAVREAEARMAARGVSRSTFAGEAVTAAILQAALPLAFQNAKVFEQMNLFNLSNQQQAMLSDQAASNAAKQFNAISQQQVDFFMANLNAQIGNFNANRIAANNQFNSAEANKIAAINASNETQIDLANAAQQTAISQFNSELANAREIFNVQNQQIIDQSNAQWQRIINTANTAAINAANQIDTQNLFNLSQFALAALWQQFRDEAAWANESGENSLDRASNITIAALQRQTAFDLLDSQQSQALFELIGEFAFNILSG